MFGEEETRNAGMGLEGHGICVTVGEETLRSNIQKVQSAVVSKGKSPSSGELQNLKAGRSKKVDVFALERNIYIYIYI